MSVELIYVCTRCLKQHEIAAAAAGCCYVMSVFWKCNICASIFPYKKKSLAEDHEMHYKPEMVFLLEEKNMSKQLDLEEALNFETELEIARAMIEIDHETRTEEALNFETELEILKAELQINKDRLNELESEREQIIEILGLEIIEDEDEEDDNWNDDEHVMFDVRPGLWDEIKLASKAEGGRAEEEGIDYFCWKLLENWCLNNNIEPKLE